VAAIQVNDGKAAKTEADGAGHEIAVVVRAAMTDRISHALD